MTRVRIAIVLVFLAGCQPKTTTTSTSVPAVPKPFVEVEPVAREVLIQIAADHKMGLDWWVRLEVVWKPEALIEVNVERKRPRATDFVVEADGLLFVMAEEQKTYLLGAHVSMRELKDGAAFDVTFPNRDGRERSLAHEWLERETARRKTTKGTKITK